MEKKEIIELGMGLGLIYDVARDHTDKYVTFIGCDGQTFQIATGEEKEITLGKFGQALIYFGRTQKVTEILRVLHAV